MYTNTDLDNFIAAASPPDHPALGANDLEDVRAARYRDTTRDLLIMLGERLSAERYAPLLRDLSKIWSAFEAVTPTPAEERGRALLLRPATPDADTIP